MPLWKNVSSRSMFRSAGTSGPNRLSLDSSRLKRTAQRYRDHVTAAKYNCGTQSPGSSMDGRTTSAKRRATPDLNPPRKRRRRVEEDLRIEVLRKTVWEFEERLESASSSKDSDTGSSSRKGTGKGTGKRKTAVEEDEGPSSRKGTGKRKTAAEEDEGASSRKGTGKRTGKRKTAAEEDEGASSRKGTGKRRGKRKAAEAGEGPSSKETGKRTGKRKTAAEEDEGPSSRKGTGKRRGKRKTAAEEDEGPSSRKGTGKRTGKRKTAAEEDEGASSRKGTGKGRGKRKAAEAGEGPSSKETGKGTGKRKAAAEDGEGPSSKRRRTTADQKDVKAKTRRDVAEEARAEFEEKYEQQQQLGQGGCGSVFAGYRRADRFPVAIKHIERDKVYCTQVDNNGRQLSVEVAIMLKIADGTTGSVGTSAPVSLLDWYDLDQELILVLERPVPCKDLLDYVNENRGYLQEDEARIIMKQLVDAVSDLQDHQIFHRDIKAENILIETGWDIPRVRIIDFGLGCFFKQRSSYRVFFGTSAHVPPEWVRRSTYRPGPTTVWQLGVVLFDSLHSRERFNTTRFMKRQLKIKKRLSEDCLDFLQLCLAQVPEQRATVEDLQQHPWLR